MKQYFPKQILTKLARGRDRVVTGFTLVELLVVLTIIAILATLSAPSLVSVFSGSALSQAGQMIQDQLTLYRQLAVNNNYIVEVRIYNFIDSSIPGDASATPPAYDTPGHYRGIQAFKVIPTSPPQITSGQIVYIKTPITKPLRLPSSIIIDAGGSISTPATNISPLIRSSTLQTPVAGVDSPIFNVGTTYTYISFQFNPDGSTNLTATYNTGLNNTNYCLMTLHERKAKDNLTNVSLPKNYYTIQIDPYTGHVNVYRP